MRLTENQLRNIIRKNLLTEGMMSPNDIKRLGLKIVGEYYPGGLNLSVTDSDGGYVGHLSLVELGLDAISYGPIDLPYHGNCNKAWMVADIFIERGIPKYHGLGPVLYDIGIEVAGDRGLTPDRTITSEEARSVWNHYLALRPDVKPIPLDYIDKPFITPGNEYDDCVQSQYLNDMFPTDPLHDPGKDQISQIKYRSHWSTNRYVKKPYNDNTISELERLGILEWIYY